MLTIKKEQIPYGFSLLLWATMALSGVVRIEPAPFDVAIALLFITALSLGCLKFSPTLNPALFLLMTFLYGNLISFIQTTDFHRGLWYLGVTIYLVVLWFFFTGIFTKWGEGILSRIFLGYTLAALLSTGACVLAFVGFPPFPEIALKFGRAVGFFKDPNVFGPFLIPISLYALGKISFFKEQRLWTWLTVFVITSLGVVLSFSRGAWLNFAVSLCVFSLLLGLQCFRFKSFLKGSMVIMVILAVTIAGALAIPGVSKLFSLRLSAHNYDQKRFATQRAAFTDGFENALGIGPGQSESRYNYATHSLYARVLAENGVIGFSSFIGFLGLTVFRAVKKSFTTRGRAQFWLVLAASTLLGLLANSFFIDTLHWRHFWLLLAIPWVSLTLPSAWEEQKAMKQPQKKVAFVATVFFHLEAFHLPFMKLLQDKGFEVHAYGYPDHGKAGVMERGIICHDVPFHRSPLHPGNLKALWRLIFSFKQEQFSLIHFNSPISGIYGRLAARITLVPAVIYTAHGFHFFKGAPFHYWLCYYPAEFIAARWADHLITINQEDYQRALKLPVRQRVSYIPGVGIEQEAFQFAKEALLREEKRKAMGLSSQDFVILCVAELIPRKNQIQLIKAVQMMVQREMPIHCLLVGNGEDELILQNEVKKRSLQANIHFLGFRRDVPELMAAVDVVALFSRHEGLTKALLEAMAAGKPIVASDVRGNRDLVISGQTGLLVPLGDIKSTAEALAYLYYHPAERLIMGWRNKTKSLDYNLQKILAMMEKIYDNALRGY